MYKSSCKHCADYSDLNIDDDKQKLASAYYIKRVFQCDFEVQQIRQTWTCVILQSCCLGCTGRFFSALTKCRSYLAMGIILGDHNALCFHIC